MGALACHSANSSLLGCVLARVTLVSCVASIVFQSFVFIVTKVKNACFAFVAGRKCNQ